MPAHHKLEHFLDEYRNPLDLVERDLVAGAVVQIAHPPDIAGALKSRDRVGPLPGQLAAVREAATTRAAGLWSAS
jgi:hypothetical protein